MGNVHSISGGLAESAPNAELVTALKALLADAEAGNLKSACWAGIIQNGNGGMVSTVNGSVIDTEISALTLVGAMHANIHEINSVLSDTECG